MWLIDDHYDFTSGFSLPLIESEVLSIRTHHLKVSLNYLKELQNPIFETGDSNTINFSVLINLIHNNGGGNGTVLDYV